MVSMLLLILTEDETVHYVQNAHVLLGGIRLRQIRLRPQSCSLCADATVLEGDIWRSQCEGDDAAAFDTECYEPKDIDRDAVSFYNDSGDVVAVYNYSSGEELKDQAFMGMFFEYPGGGYVEDLPLSLGESTAIVDELEAMQWIDGSTLLVTVDFNTYYPSEVLLWWFMM